MALCFEVYQQHQNKRKKSRSNITKQIMGSRTLAIQMEPTNPRQARQKVDSFRRQARIIVCLFTFFSTTFTKRELIGVAKASFTNPDDVFGS